MHEENLYDFHWLFKNFSFNLSQFEKFDKKLKFDGEINGISMQISLEFPFKIDNSEERVWPK